MGFFSGYTVCDLHSMLKGGKVSAVELTQEALKGAKEDKNNAFITVCDSAVDRAKEIQRKIESGELTSPLAGIPVAVKDNICTKGIPTTCASRLLEGYIPPYNATVVDRLLSAGAIVIGKTNMDEFAMGSTTESSAYGVVTNPYDTCRVAGGSGGGSAAAVATGIVPVALGSDTGGSVRTPASHCGVLGYKPTYGALSRYGLVAYASSFDVVGINARCSADCATLFDGMRGIDKMDGTSRESEAIYGKVVNPHINGLRVALIITENTRPEIKERITDVARTLEGMGATVSAVSADIYEGITPAYYIMAMAQAASNLARYDGVRYGSRAQTYDTLEDMYLNTRDLFGDEAKRRILAGTFVLSTGYYDEYYLRALRAREGLKNRFKELFGKFDIVLTPTCEDIPPRIGQSERIDL
ncbi:MAG: aspartyl/glutamyl-tRNA amidotransferase subunit A [Clostridia bacterium]|nr:aspartyl/glutamyl-tRNA amidotransferase subunit A [Clostridia bacterium]